MAEPGYTSYATASAGERISQTAKDIPVAKDVAKTVQDISKPNIASLAGDVSSFASDAGSVLADPLNALISAGLSFLMDVISPLRDALEQVTGNSGALDHAKESFNVISQDLAKLASELEDIAKSGFQNWQGAAKDAAVQKVEQFVKGVQGTANNASDVSQLLGISGTLMDAAYKLVMGIIADCIEWLIVTWVAALAAEIPTCGCSTVAAGAATAGEVAVEGANAAEKVQQTTSLLEKIANILKKITSELKKLKDAQKLLKDGKSAKGIKDVKSAEAAAKEAEKAAKGGKDAAKESKSLVDRAKEFGQKQLDSRVNNPRKDLNNWIHNPQGRLQEMAHNRTGQLGHHALQGVVDAGKDGVKGAFTNYSGDLLDQVTPGSSSQAQARADGPQGYTSGSNEEITNDLQG